MAEAGPLCWSGAPPKENNMADVAGGVLMALGILVGLGVIGLLTLSIMQELARGCRGASGGFWGDASRERAYFDATHPDWKPTCPGPRRP